MDRPALVPQADGCLRGDAHVTVPFSTPRLQGQFGPGWSVEDLAVWGAGVAGGIRISPQPPLSESAALPNRLELYGAASSFVAEALPDTPCVIVDVRAAVSNLMVTLRPAATQSTGTPASSARWHHEHETAVILLPWAVLIAWAKGGQQATRGLSTPGSSRIVLALGSTEGEAREALAYVLSRRGGMTKTAEHYRLWCGTRLETADPELGSLMTHALHAAVSSRKHDSTGAFAGLAAGSGYNYPARTYYRDGYWTSQALLPFKPEWVREQIVLLAGGVHADGEAPSAVIVPEATGSWSRMRRADRVLYRDHHSDREWWSDHFDSPLFLVILAADYVALTGDRTLLRDQPSGRSIEATLKSIGERYLDAAKDAGGLPAKPRHDRDWADNVFRAGFVTYDAMLYLGAMQSLAGLTREVGLKNRCLNAFDAGQRLLDETLWLPAQGHYADYKTLDGFVEPHLAIDSFVGSWLQVIPPQRERRLVAAGERLLVTSRNAAQPYGDWGVMACFPPYRRLGDLRGKSCFAFRYHNGSDWPYWDAVFAHSVLNCRRNSSDWHHTLMRWWSYGLEQGWPEPVEHYSPLYGRGSSLQAWSGLAAAVIAGSFGWSRAGLHSFRPTTLPATAIRGLWADGGRVDLEVETSTGGGAVRRRLRRAKHMDSQA